jgi:hypothetical protein
VLGRCAAGPLCTERFEVWSLFNKHAYFIVVENAVGLDGGHMAYLDDSTTQFSVQIAHPYLMPEWARHLEKLKPPPSLALPNTTIAPRLLSHRNQ